MLALSLSLSLTRHLHVAMYICKKESNINIENHQVAVIITSPKSVKKMSSRNVRNCFTTLLMDTNPPLKNIRKQSFTVFHC
mmetsp:Transcript_16349/g.23344  ORF Transcript_16349/g.23344 Transcript_16349/m.23344 type:complete len:81 (+) Transcript_16349:114-356(+)